MLVRDFYIYSTLQVNEVQPSIAWGYGKLPPLIPPIYWGETANLVPSPIYRGGLGWGTFVPHQLAICCSNPKSFVTKSLKCLYIPTLCLRIFSRFSSDCYSSCNDL